MQGPKFRMIPVPVLCLLLGTFSRGRELVIARDRLFVKTCLKNVRTRSSPKDGSEGNRASGGSGDDVAGASGGRRGGGGHDEIARARHGRCIGSSSSSGRRRRCRDLPAHGNPTTAGARFGLAPAHAVVVHWDHHIHGPRAHPEEATIANWLEACPIKHAIRILPHSWCQYRAAHRPKFDLSRRGAAGSYYTAGSGQPVLHFAPWLTARLTARLCTMAPDRSAHTCTFCVASTSLLNSVPCHNYMQNMCIETMPI